MTPETLVLVERLIFAVKLAKTLKTAYQLTNEVAERVDRIRKKKKEETVRRDYRNGKNLFTDRREAVVRLLFSYYSTRANQENLVGLRYVSQASNTRDLPLVTKRNLTPRDSIPLKDFECKFGGASKSVATGLTDAEKIDLVSRWAADQDALKLKIWDKPLYSLASVEEQRLQFTLTRFLEFRATFGALEDELFLTLGGLSDEAVDRVLNNNEIQRIADLLDRRQKLLPSLDHLWVGDRICPGGPIVLFVCARTDKAPICIVQRRGAGLSDEAGSLSCVPKAFHQPEISELEEVDLRNTIMRELYEELFGGRELANEARPLVWDWFIEESPLAREFLEKGIPYDLATLGLVWDLTRGNYHAAHCILVKDPTWWERNRRRLFLNWEFDEKVHPVVDLGSQRVGELLTHDGWAPEAYFTFVEGLRWVSTHGELADKLSALRASLPNLELLPPSQLGGV